MAKENENSGAPKSSTGAEEAKKLQGVFKALVRDGADFGDIIKDQVNELKKLQTGYDKVRSSIEGFRTTSIDVKRIQSQINDQLSKQFVNTAKLKQTELELQTISDVQLQGAKNYVKVLVDKETAEQNVIAAIESQDKKAITSEKKKLATAERLLERETKNLTPLQAQYVARLKSNEVIGLTVKELEKELAKEKEIQGSIGVTGKLFENFSKKLGLGDSVYEAMVNKARQLQAENEANAQKQLLRNKIIADNKKIADGNATKRAEATAQIEEWREKNKVIADGNAAKRAAAIGQIEELREKNKVREAYNIQAVAQGRKPIDLFTVPDIEEFIKTTEAYKPKDLFTVPDIEEFIKTTEAYKPKDLFELPKTEGFFSKLKADFEAIGKAEELREKNKVIADGNAAKRATAIGEIEELREKNKVREAYNIQAVAQGRKPIDLFTVPDIEEFIKTTEAYKPKDLFELPKTEGFFSKLNEKFSEVKKNINNKGFFASLKDGLTNSGKSLGTSLQSGGKKAVESLKAAPRQLLISFKVFGTGLGTMFTEALNLLKDPAVITAILSTIASGTTKMLSSGMKSIGGELAEGPIQNLTKPISGLLEKIPLVGGLLGGVVDMMSTFMDLAVNSRSQFVKMGRELGLDAAESKKLANNFSDIAQNSSDVFLNAKRLYEAQIGLSKQLGTTAIFSNEILSTNIKLKDVLGLEEDIQASIAQASVITGKESADIVGNVIQQVQNLYKAGLATQDYKAVLKEVSNLGGYLGLTFSKYPEKITKAVLQVKAMGLELKQVDALADSFLDYESSISKEMEAQVLTGREMNLNKAREFALNNDLVGLAEEITKNAGSVNNFLNDNRINQQAIAEAVGLSRDTLADMLKKSEFLKTIGATDKNNAEEQYKLAKAKYATLKDITNEQEKQQYLEIVSGTAQERLAALINKIKQGFIELTSNSSVNEFIDRAIKFMSDPKEIQGFVNGLKDFFATLLEGVGSFVNGFAKVANIFLKEKNEIREDYGDTIKAFGQSLKSSNLGNLGTPKKLNEGGVVKTTGIAQVDSGETYLGASSLQLIKMTSDNSKLTVQLLKELVNKKPDTSNAQVKFVTGNVLLDGVGTGKLMLNSFQNNSYSNFDTTRYNS